VFESWLAGATDRFTAAGIEPAAGRAAAVAIIALIEGAFVLDRAAQRTEALDIGGRVAAGLVRDALAPTAR